MRWRATSGRPSRGSDLYVELRILEVCVGRLRGALNIEGAVNPIRTIRSADYSWDLGGRMVAIFLVASRSLTSSRDSSTATLTRDAIDSIKGPQGPPAPSRF